MANGTRNNRCYFCDNIEPEHTNDLAAALKAKLRSKELRMQLDADSMTFIAGYTLYITVIDYLALVDRLVGSGVS